MAREKGAKPGNGDAEPDFESAMTELERIVEELEGNQLTLDQSLAHYERGMVLASQLTKTLDAAEQRIEKLGEADTPGEAPGTEPMERTAGERTGRHGPPEGELPF